MAGPFIEVSPNLSVRELAFDRSTNKLITGNQTNYLKEDRFVTVTVSSAELLALNATPKTIVAAPGANLAIVPRLVIMRHAAGTAYAGIAAGEDLVLKYTNGSGAQCSSVIESDGFLDAATAQIRYAGMPASTGSTAGDVAPVANAAVVLHLLVGEITTGDFDLIVRCHYDVIATNFTS